MELPPDIVERLLERWPVARLATVGRVGRPHLVPIVFARYAGSLWSPVDGKTKAAGELARVRNVRSRPEVGLILDHYEADWRRLWWVRVDGRAAVIEARDPAADPELMAVADALRVKYPQYADVPLFRREPILLRIAVERVGSWCASREAFRAVSDSAECADLQPSRDPADP
jgi:PPOX class probable F420-dependent enzyme